MLNFLKGKFQRWAASQQRQELVYFIDMLKGADVESRAMTVAFAAHIKNNYFKSDEFIQAKKNSIESYFLVKNYQFLQKQNMHAYATGVSVWLHTARANVELSNRFLAKEMWNLLKESFPYVEDQAEDLRLIMGITLDIENFESAPIEYDWIF